MHRKDKYTSEEESLDDLVIELIDSGKLDDEIIRLLLKDGYTSSEVKESLKYLR